MKTHLTISGLFLFILSCTSSPNVEGAKIHLQQGRYLQADSLLRTEIRNNPTSAEAFYWLGETNVQLQKYAIAGWAYLKAETLDSSFYKKYRSTDKTYKYWVAFSYGAKELIKENKEDSAIIFLKEAIDIDHSHGESYILLGRLYLAKNQFDKVIEISKKLLTIDSTSPEAYYLKGRVEAKKEKFQLAQKDFEKSIEFYKNNLDNYLKKGIETYKMEKEKILNIVKKLEEKALSSDKEALDKACQKETGLSSPSVKGFLKWWAAYESIKRQLADAYFWTGHVTMNIESDSLRFQKAASYLKQAIEYDNTNIEAKYDLGITYHYQKKYKECIEILTPITKDIKDDAFLYLLIGASKLNLEKGYEEAEEWLLKAKELTPNDPEIYKKLSYYYYKIKDLKRSKEMLDKAKTLEKGGK